MSADVWRLPVTRTWLGLVFVTLVGWSVVEHGGSPGFAATLVMLIAAFKVRLVVDHFMELRWRPLPWRIFFECWIVGTMLLIVGGYWLAR